MEVRALKTKDFFTVAKILSKIGSKALKEIDDTTNDVKAGMLLLTIALEKADEEMLEFLADITEMPAEEYKALPFDAPLETIELLAEKEDLKNFFARVRGLTKKLSTKQ